MRNIQIVIICLISMGCAEFSNPLTKPDKDTLDEEVYGTWFYEDKKEELSYVHIGLDDETKLLRVFWVALQKNGELDSQEFKGHTSFLGKNKYFNWIIRNSTREESRYIVLKYEITEDTLVFYTIDDDVIEEAFAKGILSGKTEKTKKDSTLLITEKQDKMQKYFLENDKRLFKKKEFLQRIKRPTDRSKQRGNSALYLTRRNLFKRTGRWRGLAIGIEAPTIHRSITPDSAGMHGTS